MASKNTKKVCAVRYTNNAQSSRRPEIRAAQYCNFQSAKQEYGKIQSAKQDYFKAQGEIGLSK